MVKHVTVSTVLNCAKQTKYLSHADVDSDDPSESEMDWREDWDHECSWRPWAVHSDPIGECTEYFTDRYFVVELLQLGVLW